MDPSDLTAVIAAKDEAATIVDVIRGCREHCGEILVVVDRRTRDATAALAFAAGARVLVDGGRGKGHALRLAIAEIRTPVAVFVDADGSHDPADIPSVVRPIADGRADHVSASRLTGGSSELHGGFDEFFRLAGSSFITACINRRFGVRLSDSQNGFRAIRTDVLRRLGLTEDSTTIEQEMIIRSLGLGFRIAEVPSHEHARKAGVSHINVRRAAFRYVFSFVRHLYGTRWRAIAPARVETERVDGVLPVNR
ncbi:MAG TPA: glycosyltransferase family 2 protein [Vicinamibacterales bacterium]|nr:glycosyltransferase family 2 protein [Vicinamibacterales bacterium]